MPELIVALPKGRLFSPSVNVMKDMGILTPGKDIDDLSRQLEFLDNKTDNKFLLAKPKDIPAYIEHGAAHIGITGKDVIMEHNRNLYELLDLGFGECSLVVAVPENSGIDTIKDIPEHSRIATSYPGITGRYFARLGIQVEVIFLNGSVELAPRVGLADYIVDISSTGTTLRKNKLMPIARIMHSSARLIVNRVAYKTQNDKIRELREWGNSDEKLELSC